MYLKDILKDHDILCCQKHWLMNYEKELLNDNIDTEIASLKECLNSIEIVWSCAS